MLTLTNPVWGNLRLSTLSPSKISAYIRCGVRFKLEYVHGYKAPSNLNAHRGTGLHAAIEADNKYFMINDRHMLIDDLFRIGNKAFDEKLEEGVFIPARDESKTDKLIEKARSEMNQSIELYDKMEKPWIPESVEMNIKMDIGYPLPVNMRPDLIDREHIIWDWKSMDKNNHFEVSLQDLIYCKAHEILEGIKPHFNYVKFILTKKTPPRVEIQEIAMPPDYAILDQYVEKYITAIENNIYLPASSTDYMCSEGGCPFYLNCEFKYNRGEYL